jgi:hypothetical protein
MAPGRTRPTPRSDIPPLELDIFGPVQAAIPKIVPMKIPISGIVSIVAKKNLPM